MMAKPERFAQYARKVWNVEETDDIDAAIAGIEKTVEYFASLDMPVCLPDLEQPGDKGKVGVLSEEVLYELGYDEDFYASADEQGRYSEYLPAGQQRSMKVACISVEIRYNK